VIVVVTAPLGLVVLLSLLIVVDELLLLPLLPPEAAAEPPPLAALPVEEDELLWPPADVEDLLPLAVWPEAEVLWFCRRVFNVSLLKLVVPETSPVAALDVVLPVCAVESSPEAAAVFVCAVCCKRRFVTCDEVLSVTDVMAFSCSG
jgi:hypothetical protein